MNKLEYYYGITLMLVVFGIPFLWVFFLITILFSPETLRNILLKKGHVIDYPERIQPLFPYIMNNKLFFEKGIDSWSIKHILLYFIIGLIYPGEYIYILIVSILFELYELIVGLRCRLSDVLYNLLGYYIGSQIAFRKSKEIREYITKIATKYINYIIFLSVFTAISIYLLLNYNPKSKKTMAISQSIDYKYITSN